MSPETRIETGRVRVTSSILQTRTQKRKDGAEP